VQACKNIFFGKKTRRLGVSEAKSWGLVLGDIRSGIALGWGHRLAANLSQNCWWPKGKRGTGSEKFAGSTSPRSEPRPPGLLRTIIWMRHVGWRSSGAEAGAGTVVVVSLWGTSAALMGGLAWAGAVWGRGRTPHLLTHTSRDGRVLVYTLCCPSRGRGVLFGAWFAGFRKASAGARFLHDLPLKKTQARRSVSELGIAFRRGHAAGLVGCPDKFAVPTLFS